HYRRRRDARRADCGAVADGRGDPVTGAAALRRMGKHAPVEAARSSLLSVVPVALPALGRGDRSRVASCPADIRSRGATHGRDSRAELTVREVAVPRAKPGKIRAPSRLTRWGCCGSSMSVPAALQPPTGT